MSERAPRLSWIEYVVVLVAVLFLLRLFFGDAFAAFDRRLLYATGLSEPSKYLVAGPAVALVLLWRLRRSHWIGHSRTPPATSRLMVIDAAVILLGAGAVVWMAAGAQ